MKLVGGDSGRYEHEQFVESVVLAPSERVIVDVLFDQPGQLTLGHQTPERRLPPWSEIEGEHRGSIALTDRAIQRSAHERGMGFTSASG